MTNEQTLYRKLAKRKAECDDVPDDNEEKSRRRNLTEKQKKLDLAEKIVESVKKSTRAHQMRTAQCCCWIW